MTELKSSPSIAVVDVETTGLFPSRHDRIIEIGIVVIRPDGDVSVEFESLVNPKRDIGPTSVHGLTSGHVLRAPKFEDIAGQILDTLSDTVALAGHNVRFDYQFLKSEFDRLGCELPVCQLLCTMQLAGGGSLEHCCDTFAVDVAGSWHSALADAQAASRLLITLLQDQPKVYASLHTLKPIQWPRFDGMRKPALTRSASTQLIETEFTYLQRLLRRRKCHALPEATDGATIAYGALLDRALEDRRLDEIEAEALVDMATKWGLDNDRVEKIHWDYLMQLVITALADGRLSKSEIGDLGRVARLLGKDQNSLDSAIQDAIKKLSEPQIEQDTESRVMQDLRGHRVCFTGELQGQIGGRRISREMAEDLASNAGLTVVETVTKSCDLLVLADPSSQSGKAKKARALGVRIVHESVFWKYIGAAI